MFLPAEKLFPTTSRRGPHLTCAVCGHEIDAIEPCQPACGSEPEITVALLNDEKHRTLGNAVLHLPGINAVRLGIDSSTQPADQRKKKEDRCASPFHVRQGWFQNNPISAIAGLAADFTMRSRTFVVVTGPVRSKRQLPMLVAVANSLHFPPFH